MDSRTAIENRKNIYIFRHYASPPELPGSIRHHNLARAMTDYGYNTFIFPSTFHHMLKKKIHHIDGIFRKENYDGVNYIWLQGIPYSANGFKRIGGMIHYGLQSYRASLSLYQKGGQKPRLVIGSIAHSFAALSAILVAKRFEVKFWLDIGDLWPEGLISAGTLTKTHPLTYLFRWIGDYLYRKADLIIVLNNAAKEYFIKRGFSNRKVILFPPSTIFKKPEREHINLPDKAFRIIYSGSLSALYPLEEAIKAVSALVARYSNNIILEIVGKGTNGEKLKSIANDLCPNNIIFSGIVPRTQLFSIYQNADALLVIEKDVGYGFPNKLIDYCGAAKPIVIASEHTYGLNGQAAVHALPKAESIFEAVKKLIEMPQTKREEIGMNAFNYGRKHFDIKMNFEKLLIRHLN